MKFPFLLIFAFFICFLSCNDADDDNQILSDPILKKSVFSSYSPYGNQRVVTYYSENKPVLDSTFYFSEDYPIGLQSVTKYLYDENGRLQHTYESIVNSTDVIHIEFVYDTQGRLQSIQNSNNVHTYEYSGNQITLTYAYPGMESYQYVYETDANDNLVSRTGINGNLDQTATYTGNNLSSVSHSSYVTYFNYMENTTVPEYMKHPEFGNYKHNYALYRNSISPFNIEQPGTQLLQDRYSDFNGNTENMNIEYEFNEDNLPIYYSIGYGDIQYLEIFYELE